MYRNWVVHTLISTVCTPWYVSLSLGGFLVLKDELFCNVPLHRQTPTSQTPACKYSNDAVN